MDYKDILAHRYKIEAESTAKLRSVLWMLGLRWKRGTYQDIINYANRVMKDVWDE